MARSNCHSMYTNCYISAIVFNWISYLLLKDAKQSVLIKKKLRRDEGGGLLFLLLGAVQVSCDHLSWRGWVLQMITLDHAGGGVYYMITLDRGLRGGRGYPHHTKKYPQCFPKYHRCIPKYHRYIPKYPWQSPKYPHHTSKYPWHTPKYPIIPQSIISLWSSNCKNGHLCHNVHHPVKKKSSSKVVVIPKRSVIKSIIFLNTRVSVQSCLEILVCHNIFYIPECYNFWWGIKIYRDGHCTTYVCPRSLCATKEDLTIFFGTPFYASLF